MIGETTFWDLLFAYGPLFLALIVLYQWMVERPRQKAEMERLEKLRNLKKNDRVITSGGIIGIVSSVKDRILTIRTAEETKFDVLRDHVQLYDPDKEKKDKPVSEPTAEKTAESKEATAEKT